MKLFSRIFSMLVTAFAFSVLFCTPTFAEESLSITVDGVPQVEATPNVLGTGSVDVYVSSSSRDGYKLMISDSDNDNSLVSGFNSIAPLAGSVTADNFTTNAWGIKVGDNFLPVPKLSDGALELIKTTAAASNEKHTITFGMKVDDTTVSGDYSSEVVFTAVANPLTIRKSTLKQGRDINTALKKLANSGTSPQYGEDTNITSIQKYASEFTDEIQSSAVDIAHSSSDSPVYAWFDDGVIYYYTEADEVFLNANCTQMFYNMQSLISIDMNFGAESDVDPDGDGIVVGVQEPVYITSNVTDMESMFKNAHSLTTIDVSKWDTSNVVDMQNMFDDTFALVSLDVSNWDTSKVTDMHMMFNSSMVPSLTTLDVSKWDVGNVTDMSGMFSGQRSLAILDVSNWDVSNVTDMSRMFNSNTSRTTIDVSKWNTGKVTNMNSMFSINTNLTSLDVSKWNTSNVTDMDRMFQGTSSLTALDVSNWDTSSVIDMSWMFNVAGVVILDMSNWDTSKVTDMSGMFYGASALTTIYASSKFNTGVVTQSSNMFKNVTSLVGGNGTTYDSNHLDKEYARIDRPGTPGYFTEKQRAVRKATLKPGYEINDAWRFTLNADPTSVERFTGTFTDALQNAAINIAMSTSAYPVYTWNSGSTIYYYTEADEVYLNSNSSGMFAKLYNLRSIDFNFGLESDVDPDGDGYVGFISEPVFITSNVTSMSNMFYYASALTTLDLSGMDTRNVTDMSSMFEGSSSLTTIYASNLFNTNAVTDSSWMFIDATNLTGGNGTAYNASHTDKEYARIDTAATPGYFTLKTN